MKTFWFPQLIILDYRTIYLLWSTPFRMTMELTDGKPSRNIGKQHFWKYVYKSRDTRLYENLDP